MNKILVIGNMGYVGSELVKYFYKQEIYTEGLDSGLFASKLTSSIQPEVYLNTL